MNFENKWNSEDSDGEEEDETYIQNEIAPPEISEEFRNNVLNLKHIIYDSTILKPELGTSNAQSNKPLSDYLKNINGVYVLCLNAQKGIINDGDLNRFPEKARQPLKQILGWLSDYFRKNRVPDTIPYEDYINKSFKEYQFVQDNSFE
jgi:hypothetical protein